MTQAASGVLYDAALDARVTADIVRYRQRRSVFSALSICLIVSELMLGVAVLFAHINDTHGAQALVLASTSAFLLTLDVSFGIRERAAAHHATLNQLLGIRNQMLFPASSTLWQEYGTVRAYTKINYVEAVLDGCSWYVPVTTGGATGAAAALQTDDVRSVVRST